ncbi:hypothetical protein QYF36_009761 [Acer negundo]|nr:hypothetical protein QYF36_009761 [Acer negundo]
MAELVVSALLGAIFSSLTSSPFRSLKLDGKWLNDLKSYLLRIDAILDDVDLKDHGNRELKLWFDKLKEVRYEIEDMLNEIVTEGFRREWEAKSRNIKSRVRGIVSIKSSFEKDIQHRWKSITKKIEYLQMHREKFGLEYAPMIARKPDQLSVAKEGPEDESQAWRSVKKDTERKRFQRPTSSLVTIPEVIAVSHKVRHLSFAGDLNAERCQAICGAKSLQNVIPAGDAYEASLKKKAFLQGLELEWSNELEWGNAGVDSQNGTHVLKKLEPHKNLEKLSIISFSGIRFPDWLGDPSFSKMVFLRLRNCNSCLCLPPLGQLPSLKELEIEGMNGIERVGSEFYGMNPDSDKPFPSLEILVFRELTNWEEWISPEEEGENFPCLKQIRISGCLKLAKCLPLHLSSAKVEISECPLLRVPVTDGNKMQLENEYDIVSSELMTDVSSQTHSSCPELSMLSTELAIPKLPVTVDKQVHEGNSRKENILDRSSTSRLSKVEELQLPDTNVVRSTDVSITSNRPPPESPTHLTEDSSAKHGGALDTSLAATEISADTVTDDPINDEGNKAQFRRNEKVLDRPSTSRLQEIEELQLPVSDVVQRTDVLATSNSPPPESSERLTEDSSVKHEGASDNSSAATMILSDTNTDDPINDEGDKAQLRRNENLLDRPSTSRLQEIEELQLPDVNVPQITDVSITSNMPPPESPTRLTEDSTAKHEGASDNSSAPTEISSDTDDPINDEGDKAQFRRNEKLLARPSTSRLQELEELQLPDSNVARRTAVLATSNSPPSESSKRLTEDSSIKYRGASDNSSAATEISSDSDTDNPINIWYDEESLEDISSPEQESLNVSEISQLKRLPPKLYSLKIEACKALKSLPEELMHSNLQHLYIINCQFLKSIQASHLPVPLKTLYIRKCKKLKFLSAEETTGKHASVEHLCIESSCDPLKSFPLSLFPKLKNLTIWDCVNFNTISITEDHMSLNSLEIRDCTNLESLSKGGLRTPNLTSILLSNCKNLKQLPGQLHELKSLQSLFINECPELDSIPEGGLPSSLNLLRISSCHKLTPGLQWGLHQLNNFSRIEIEAMFLVTWCLLLPWPASKHAMVSSKDRWSSR